MIDENLGSSIIDAVVAMGGRTRARQITPDRERCAYLAKQLVLAHFPDAHDVLLRPQSTATKWDFMVGDKSVRVRWASDESGELTQHVGSSNTCKIYILVTGMGMTIRGWASGKELLVDPIDLFGRGPDTYCLMQRQLHPMSELPGWKEEAL